MQEISKTDVLKNDHQTVPFAKPDENIVNIVGDKKIVVQQFDAASEKCLN
jgi:hypothetical protein